MPHNEQTDEWNPRFVNYARIHGQAPQEQLDADRVRWPGGAMCGFTLWNNARIAEYAKTNPAAFLAMIKTPWDRHGGRPRLLDHEAYDAWLSALEVGHGIEDAKPTPSVAVA